METFKINPAYAKNAGDAGEWGLCNFFRVFRVKHDSLPYDKASDLSVNGMNISIKTSGFSLMAATLCNGLTSFDEIWELFAENVHSDHFAYVSKDWTVYMMNKQEFKAFVYAFCALTRESSKNGGGTKIRCRKESAKMLKWLADKAAA